MKKILINFWDRLVGGIFPVNLKKLGGSYPKMKKKSGKRN